MATDQHTPSPLADDRLDGVPAISEEWYGERTPSAVRRTRYLIAAHGLPVVQRGRHIWSFKSWLARYARGEPIKVGQPEAAGTEAV
jgi:hypothetical protein